MAIRKRRTGFGAKPRSAGRSLREQLAALPLSEAAGPGEVAPAPRPPETRSPAPEQDNPSFKELAADVRPLREPVCPALPPAPVPSVTLSVAPKARLWVERRDGAVWALADGLPARLLEELRAGKVVPRRELDLHRRSALEARQLLDEGLPRARREGVSCLLVVCGRGAHSGAEGPVLPDVVLERLSEELADEILAFCTAPRRWGGEGAIIVRLRAPPAAHG